MLARALAGSARRTVRRWAGRPHSSSTSAGSPRSPDTLPASSSYTCHSATIGPHLSGGRGLQESLGVDGVLSEEGVLDNHCSSASRTRFCGKIFSILEDRRREINGASIESCRAITWARTCCCTGCTFPSCYAKSLIHPFPKLDGRRQIAGALIIRQAHLGLAPHGAAAQRHMVLPRLQAGHQPV